jgi:signal transduction histidine kinase
MESSESRQARFDALAAALAQELRNPLSTITLSLELLREELTGRAASAAQAVRRVDAVLEDLNRLDRVFAEFLRFAREPRLERQPADMNVLLEDALAVIRHRLAERRVTPVLQLDRRKASVQVDHHLIRQALVCLLDNVVGTVDGGTLTVQTRVHPPAFEIDVIDTAPGVARAQPPRAFDMFFTQASGESGVGLALTRKIVELHGGSVGFETAPSGHRYSILLPLAGARG